MRRLYKVITFHAICKNPQLSRIKNYSPYADVFWIVVENDLTKGLSAAKPNYYECFSLSQYSFDLQDALRQYL
jgi:hypothetical protein